MADKPTDTNPNIVTRSSLQDLRTLLSQDNISTQEEISHALTALGHSVTQSKVSRMLRRLGAVKAKNEAGMIVYRLPKEPAPPTRNTPLSALIIDIDHNESQIIIHTSPGSASLIARILDYHLDKIGILGTIAGDDTILVIPKSSRQTKHVASSIEELLFV